MKAWSLARVHTICGGCAPPTHIRKGDPVLELTGPGWRAIRCAACADEPVPDAIDDQHRTRPVIGAQLAVRLDQIRGLSRDWKHAQAGDLA